MSNSVLRHLILSNNEMNKLTINGRFQGPDHMGNGGYVAGLLAQSLDNQAQVRSL